MEIDKIRILAIDDLEDNLISLKALIYESFPNAKVFTASNGMQGLEMAVAIEPDLILLDVLMPKMDGYQVCQKLKADEELKDIPVVFLTALRDDKVNRIKALEVGAEAFLAKPIDNIELIAQIRAMFKIKEASQLKKSETERLKQLVDERTEHLKQELIRRTEAEEKLRQSEEKYKLLSNLTFEGIIIHRNGKILEVNHSFLEITGYKYQEIIGKNVFDYVHPDDINTVKENINKEYADSYIIRAINAKGELRFVEIQGRNFLKGDEIFRVIALRDVTIQQQNEIALEEGRKRMTRTFDKSPIAMGISRDRIITEINPKTCELLGYQKEELIGQNNSILYFSAEENRRSTIEITHQIEAHGVGETETIFRKKNGELINILLHAIILSLPDQAPTVLATAIDITERKQTEKQVNHIARHYQAIIENAADGIVLINQFGLFKYISNSAKKMFGDLPEGLYQQNPKECIHPDDIQWLDEELNKIVLNPSFQPTLEYRLRNSKDEYFWVESTFSNLFHDLDVQAIVINFRNITDRKIAKQALIESEKKYHQFYDLTRLMTDTLPELIWAKNLQKEYIFANKAICNEFLMTNDTEEPIGKTDVYFSERERDKHPENPNWHTFGTICNKSDQEVLQSKTLIKVEETFYIKGALKVFETIKAPMYNEEGSIIGIVGTSKEITSRKIAEAELKNSEEKYRMLFNIHRDCLSILTLPTDGSSPRIIAVNDAAAKLFGYPKEQLINSTLVELNNCFCNEIVAEQMLELIEKGTLEFESSFVDRKGEKHIVDVKITIIQYQGIKARLNIIRDITSRKLAQDKSEEQYSLLNALINSPKDINIFSVDRNYCFTTFNTNYFKEMRVIWKKNIELGKNILEYIDHQATLMEVKSRIDRVLKGESFNEIQHQPHFDVYYGINWNPVIVSGEVLGATVFIQNITERKRAEKHLADSEEKHRILFLDSPDAYLVQIDGVFVDCNKATARMFACQKEQIIGKTSVDLSPDIQLDGANSSYAAMQHIANAFKTGLTTFDWIHKRIDNTEFYCEVSLSSIPYNGKAALFTTVRDISERRIVENQLVESEQNYRQLTETMQEYLAVVDAKGNFLFANAQAVKLFELNDKNSLIGYNIQDFVAQRQADDLIQQYQEVIEKGEILNQELNLIIGGTNKWFYNSLRPLYFGKDKTPSVMTILMEITDSKRSVLIQQMQLSIMRDILQSESFGEIIKSVISKLGQLFNTSNFFVALYNAEKNTLNQVAFQDEIGFYNEWSVDQSISGQLIKQAKTLLLNKKQINALISEQEIELIGKVPACFMGVPIYLKGEIKGVMVLQHYTITKAFSQNDTDILEMVSHQISIFLERQLMIEDLTFAKQKAEESERLKSAFLANMSHEIRTPMNGILGFAGLLSEPNLSGDDRRDYVDIIVKSGNRMLNIINDIINISKIESGLMQLSISVNNINHHIDYIRNFFKLEASQKDISIFTTKTLLDEQAEIVCDKEKLLAILINLVKNALKFTDEGFVEFGYELKGEFLEFYVKDSGIGIPENRREAVFERFIQADISDVRAFQGAGLGLSITKAYVEMMGGKLWLSSDDNPYSENHGSTFHFTIPYIIDKKGDTLAVGHDVRDMSMYDRKLKVLIVDDVETSRTLLSISIKDFCMEIITAENGLQAVELCKKHQDLDLVLMDLKMPIMDGFQATRLIRQFNQKIIILAQTAYALLGDRELAMAAGCSDYITKPINSKVLHEIIDRNFRPNNLADAELL